MNIFSLEEPELEFAGGQKHVDIRFGLSSHGPLDLLSDLAPKNIRLGLIGTSESIEGFAKWLGKCANGIPAKASKQPHLFPAFPSMNGKTAFQCAMVFHQSLQRAIPRQKCLILGSIGSIEQRIMKAVELFAAEIADLSETAKPDVVVCAFPSELVDVLDDPNQTTPFDFHDLLKSRVMETRIPIQIVLPSLYDPSKAKKQRGLVWRALSRTRPHERGTSTLHFITKLGHALASEARQQRPRYMLRRRKFLPEP